MVTKYESREKHTIICETVILFSFNQMASLVLLDSTNFEISPLLSLPFRSINEFFYLSFLRSDILSRNLCYAGLIWSSVIGDSSILLQFVQFVFVHFLFGHLLLDRYLTLYDIDALVYCLVFTVGTKFQRSECLMSTSCQSIFLSRLFVNILITLIWTIELPSH